MAVALPVPPNNLNIQSLVVVHPGNLHINDHEHDAGNLRTNDQQK